MSDGRYRTIRLAHSRRRMSTFGEEFKLIRMICPGARHSCWRRCSPLRSARRNNRNPTGRGWIAGLDADSRSRLLLAAMTRDEKLALVFGYFSTDAPWKNFKRPRDGLEQSAGYIGGIARLGIPALLETDAGIGVASQPGTNPRLRTALPSNLAIAASWDPELAYAGGRMIGNEARQSGFNVMLAGGINLAREPRNGRNFEYGGEDPLLAANIVAAQIRGIQSNHIISTIKHFALNDQETNRTTLSVQIDERAARMSDLLAFELAIGQSQPGAVMCGYNRINGVYSCENPWLLDEVLKQDWGYRGFVMSDWGATHSTIPAANAGLDQESGFPFDASPYFADALKEAVEDGYVPTARLDDMTARILRSMFANGLFDDPLKAGGYRFRSPCADESDGCRRVDGAAEERPPPAAARPECQIVADRRLARGCRSALGRWLIAGLSRRRSRAPGQPRQGRPDGLFSLLTHAGAGSTHFGSDSVRLGH